MSEKFNQFNMEKDQSLPQITKVWSIKSTPRKPAFQCDFCHENFRTIQSMKVHLRGHANKHKENRPPYFCQACSKAFLERDKLLEHIKHHYRSLKSDHPLPSFKMDSPPLPKLTRFACGICSYTYSSKTTLKKHQEKAHSSKSDQSFKMDSSPPPRLSRFACRICSNTYSSDYYLRKHQEKAHSSKIKVKSYECKLCGETVPKYLATSHLRTVHPTYLNCDICNVSFATKRHLNDHKKIYHQKAVHTTHIERNECDICHKSFSNRNALNTHKRNHHQTYYVYVCRFCPETFAYVDHLRYHEMRHTSEEKQES